MSTAEQSLALQQDALAAGCERVYSDVASGALDEKVGFRSLTEAIDTTTTGGKLVFHIFGALAEFERDVIRSRTIAGLAAARARGRLGGRPRIMSPVQVEAARKLLADPSRPMADVCTAMRVSKATLYRYVPASTRLTEPAPPTRVALQPTGGP